MGSWHNASRRSRVLSVVFVAFMLLLTGCASTQPTVATQPTKAVQRTATATPVPSGPPLDLHFDSDRVPINTVADLCHFSLVADVMAGALGQPHWNTPTGARPAGVLNVDVVTDHGYRIYTPLTFSKMAILVDHRQQPTSEYVQMGGKVGQDQIWNDSYPQLTSGSHYVVTLLPTIDTETQGYTEKILVVRDAFPVDEQGVVLFKPEIIEQGVVTQQEEKIALSDLARQLANCK